VPRTLPERAELVLRRLTCNTRAPTDARRPKNVVQTRGGSHYGHCMTLRLVDADMVPMDKHTFMWVQLTHFAFETAQDDRSVLTSLIASPGYAHDYASPFNAAAVVTEPAVHGRWWRSSIHPELFTPWSASDAESLIQDWADHQDWTEPSFRQPPAVQRRLQDVYAVLRSGGLYKLENPGAEDEHEYGRVTGGMGFHEFVVIDRKSHSVHVVVASDD
jgi:hypothetical protein